MNIKIASFIGLFILGTCSSCQAVETVFKAGMWWAFFLVAVGIVLILWLLSKFRKRD